VILRYLWAANFRGKIITDNLGNTITYTLDNMGNRIGEVVKDKLGNLNRQISRVYDSLNRLQQVTGGTQ
jgi:hypothetical protein